MKLQIALDNVSYEGAKELLEKVKNSIDIIEIVKSSNGIPHGTVLLHHK